MPDPARIAEIRSEPHYAVIFTSLRRDDIGDGYQQAAERMIQLAAEQDGFLGVESARDQDRLGITVSYWRDVEAIRAWRDVAEHRNVQELGRRLWYREFAVRVCRVERSYGFVAPDGPGSF